jgi:pimeloyl-ACP methyl ester carboxylesterase
VLQTIARNTIGLLPIEAGFVIARELAARPPRVRVASHEAAAMKSAERRRNLGWSGDAAWSWGRGPEVALVHGWGGRAAQMAPLAAAIADLGYRTTVFDIAGHGDSKVTQARWEYFIRDIGTMADRIGDVAAWIGHSAGGLAMMAARRVAGVSARKYVCICAPSHPFPPVRALAKRLNAGPALLARYRQFLGEQFQTTWDDLAAGSAFAGAGSDLLLCYDENDRLVDHTEGDRIHALCSGSQLVKTDAFGHTRILASPELAHTVGAFLKPPTAA